MFVDGCVVTAGEKTRLHAEPFGVRTLVRDKCEPGFTLFSPAFGYREYLIDLRGLVVHTWPVTHSDVAELLPNGNLLTHNDGSWLEEIAPDGSVVWRWEGLDRLETNTHHDFYNVDGDEIVFVARKLEPVKPGVFPAGVEPDCMKTDLVMRINRRKEVLWEFSLGDHIEEICSLAGLPMPIPFATRQPDGTLVPRGPADWAHTNTVECLPATPLGARDPRFRAGNVLLSFRSLDTIAVVDPEKDAVVWAYGPGTLDGQHQPTMLADGHILVFDNGTVRGHSIVRELVPETGEIVWEYANGSAFFSPFRSGNQRLANGNTLICECDAGHLFEVTADKEIVWDFWSPFVAQGASHLGKRIHRATRYSPAAVVSLLEARGDRVIAEVDYDGRPVRTVQDLIGLYQKEGGPC